MNKATEIKEEKKKPPFKKGIEWLSESIDIDKMHRIKGKQGIFLPVTLPNKSKLVRMRRFMSDEAYTVPQPALESLSHFVIYKTKGRITLLEAFDNLQKYFNNQPVNELDPHMPEILMGTICPMYDGNKFKDYHAKKIIKWYNEIVSAINKAIEKK